MKHLLSVGTLVVAIVGAFGTNALKTDNAKLATRPGYIFQSGTCVFKNNCQDVNTGILCTETQTGGAQLYHMSAPGVCDSEQLWRLP